MKTTKEQRIEELLAGILTEAEKQPVNESAEWTERQKFVESYIEKHLNFLS